MLRFEWDAAKARSNMTKHGIPFDTARRVFFDPFHVVRLCLAQYDEVRYRAVGMSDVGELFVVYTLRGQNIRLISAREATRHESHRYWNHRHQHALR